MKQVKESDTNRTETRLPYNGASTRLRPRAQTSPHPTRGRYAHSDLQYSAFHGDANNASPRERVTFGYRSLSHAGPP